MEHPTGGGRGGKRGYLGASCLGSIKVDRAGAQEKKKKKHVLLPEPNRDTGQIFVTKDRPEQVKLVIQN